ncbi:MAG: hypothetical protein J6P12_02105 [Methanobrevibacter sp.]|nr:hypothetical protein [Methanobrevibacter sp.]
MFSVEYERTIKQNSMFSFETHIFNIIDDETGELLYIRKGVKIKVILEILTKEIYVIYHNKKYKCNDLGPAAKDRRKNTVDNSKELNELLMDLNQTKNNKA